MLDPHVVDKCLFEINLMKDFVVSSVSSLQTKGYLGPYQMSVTESFLEKNERFLTAIFLKKLPLQIFDKVLNKPLKNPCNHCQILTNMSSQGTVVKIKSCFICWMHSKFSVDVVLMSLMSQFTAHIFIVLLLTWGMCVPVGIFQP